MTDREKSLLQVIAGLCANPNYYHDVTAPHKNFAKTVVEDAKTIVNEIFKDSNDSTSA
jgi:hypothetical protein